MGFSVSLLYTHKFIAPEARFRAKSIRASPIIIACKTAKLFKFLQVHSHRKCTIE